MDNKQDNQEFLKENHATQLNQSEAIVLAGKLIADAVDRHTDLQRKNIEIQMKMAGLAGEMFENMKRSLGNLDEGEEWKRDQDDQDDQDELI
jgi:20S proteasome alpha/beta subunit